MGENNSFVFYKTAYQTFKELKNADKELAYQLLEAMVDYGITGGFDNSNPILSALMVHFTNGVDNAKDRYEKAVENGKKGGRPKEIEDEKVAQLKSQGLTNKQMAEELGVSLSTVERANKRNRQNRQNLNVNVNDNLNINRSCSSSSGSNMGEKNPQKILPLTTTTSPQQMVSKGTPSQQTLFWDLFQECKEIGVCEEEIWDYLEDSGAKNCYELNAKLKEYKQGLKEPNLSEYGF